jgi:hypothetical protein
VLIVAEAMHETGGDDLRSLIATVEAELTATWPVTTKTTILSAAAPRFDPAGTVPAQSPRRGAVKPS